MTAGRDIVVWVGMTAPEPLRAELAARGLSLMAEPDLSRVIAISQHGGRAAIVYVPDSRSLQDDLHRLVEPCRDAGSLVVLATDRREYNRLVAINEAQAVIEKDLGSGKPQLFVLDEIDSAARLAEICRTHEPGPSRETAPQLEPSELVEALEPGLCCLLERAFHGMTRVELFEFKRGRSSARVFRADGIDAVGRKHIAMIAKIDHVERIRQEILNMEAFVHPYVETWWYAALIRERCMYGSRHAVLVGTFLAGARALDEYLPTAASPATTVVAMFDGPLKAWRANARVDVPLKLGEAYRGWGVLEADPSALIEAHRRAAEGGYDVLGVNEVVAALDGLPAVRVKIRIAHGDLQPRNVFVRDARDVLLIDFYGTKHEAAVSRDAANLDVTLAFDPNASLDESALRRLYRVPVLQAATGVFAAPWLAAIAQVRAQTVSDGVTEWEYDVSVACYLLRMARLGVQYGDLSGERIGLAYFLASELVRSVLGRSPPATLL